MAARRTAVLVMAPAVRVLATQRLQLHRLAERTAVIRADGSEDFAGDSAQEEEEEEDDDDEEDKDTDPHWGCGLLGPVPGVSIDGRAVPETQRLIDGMRKSSSLAKVWYWNWDLAPFSEAGKEQRLTKDFLFMPEQWGVSPVKEDLLRPAGKANFSDGSGNTSQATMADVFLGYNEPDIRGSCMGDLFGDCVQPCDERAVAFNDCPIANMQPVKGKFPPNRANKRGQCNCWKHSQASGAGFWPVEGCAAAQPLPTLFEDAACLDIVMSQWRETARIARSKGFRYLTTPLVAASLDYARSFLKKACAECQDISCGCPVYIAFHFYAYDCQPIALKGYATFQKRVDAVAAIMEEFPFVKGAIVNEVGMLNCGDPSNPICVPNSGKYPMSEQEDGGCPSTEELPKGIPTFVEELLRQVASARTKDGREIVKAFAWFNQNGAGGTYDLRLFDDDGKLSDIGEAYIRGCTRWGAARHRHRPHKRGA